MVKRGIIAAPSGVVPAGRCRVCHVTVLWRALPPCCYAVGYGGVLGAVATLVPM